MAEEPYFLEEWIDELIHALSSYAAGDGEALVSLLRDSPRRREFRTIALSNPHDSLVWQVPHSDPPEPVRRMGEVHDLVRAIEAREAAIAAVRELRGNSDAERSGS